jgi:hypothetical protein
MRLFSHRALAALAPTRIFALWCEYWNECRVRCAARYDYSLGPAKQQFKSCGQFNNVLQQLLHALAVARQLQRTLVLPGFYFRRVSLAL